MFISIIKSLAGNLRYSFLLADSHPDGNKYALGPRLILPTVVCIVHASAKNKIEYFLLFNLLIEYLTIYNNTTAPQRDMLRSAEEDSASCDFDMDCTSDSEDTIVSRGQYGY